MSLEAIERITKLEETLRAEKADAQTQCRAMKEAALRAGEAHLVEVRRAAAQQEKELLAQAEQRAAEKGEEIARTARAQTAASDLAALCRRTPQPMGTAYTVPFTKL